MYLKFSVVLIYSILGHEIPCKKTKSNIKQNNSTILVGTSLQKCLEKTFPLPHSGEINMWYSK
jgi:hypothetical protein